MTMGLEVKKLAGALGAELGGIDLSVDLDGASVDSIWAQVLEHQVVFFPDQHLDRDQHVALGRCFGALEKFLPGGVADSDDEHPELLSLRSEEGRIADLWHTDVTWSETPPVASVVRMVQTPGSGGDTMWSNQELAFAALTQPMQEMLIGLTAQHTGRPIGQPDSRARHPVVRVHPETGVPALFVNRQFTQYVVELSPDENDVLLPFLFDWCEREPFTCRYRWSEGTVAIWDNRNTMHYVVNDFTEPRVLERVTLTGDEPQPYGPTTWPAYEVEGISAAAGRTLMRG